MTFCNLSISSTSTHFFDDFPYCIITYRFKKAKINTKNIPGSSPIAGTSDIFPSIARKIKKFSESLHKFERRWAIVLTPSNDGKGSK
jgi:hypothetical protein